VAVVNKIGTYLPNPPTRTSVTTTSAVEFVNQDTAYYPQNPIVPGTQAYDTTQVREPGNLLFDPVTGTHIVVYSGAPGSGAADIVACAYLSADGETGWYPHPENPISGYLTPNRAEDPYLCKNINTGHLYRDGAGLAYMYVEEKPSFDGQRGINLWRSAANLLTGWTLYGRVVDKGGVGDWDENDRTSPVVFHDGTSWHMLFEGRSPTNEGEIGYASSSDGLTWTVAADPIIERGTSGAWNDEGVVCDDVIKVGSTYVLLAHAKGTRVGNGTNFNNIGRWSTTVAPSSWVLGSFTEMAGNPLTTALNTIMFVHNDPGRCLVNIGNADYWYADWAVA
jgi:hypothetical protein